MCLKNAVRWFSFPSRSRLQIVLETDSNWANFIFEVLYIYILIPVSRVRGGDSLDAVSLLAKLTTRLDRLTTVEKVSQWLLGGLLVGWWNCRWHPNSFKSYLNLFFSINLHTVHLTFNICCTYLQIGVHTGG